MTQDEYEDLRAGDDVVCTERCNCTTRHCEISPMDSVGKIFTIYEKTMGGFRFSRDGLYHPYNKFSVEKDNSKLEDFL
jgi:ketosteroid isomerase-like protein